METSKFVGVILAILLAIGVMYVRYGGKDRMAQRVHDDVAAQLAALPDYSQYEGVYLGVLDAHYMEMFERHTTVERVSRRRTRVVLDAEPYLDELFMAMIADAGAQGYKTQADHIRSLRPDIGVSGGGTPPRRR